MLLCFADMQHVLCYVDTVLRDVDAYFRYFKTSLCHVATSLRYVKTSYRYYYTKLLSFQDYKHCCWHWTRAAKMADSDYFMDTAIQDEGLGAIYSNFVEKKRLRTNNCKCHSDFVTEYCNVPVYKT